MHTHRVFDSVSAFYHSGMSMLPKKHCLNCFVVLTCVGYSLGGLGANFKPGFHGM